MSTLLKSNGFGENEILKEQKNPFYEMTIAHEDIRDLTMTLYFGCIKVGSRAKCDNCDFNIHRHTEKDPDCAGGFYIHDMDEIHQHLKMYPHHKIGLTMEFRARDRKTYPTGTGFET
jgi:hypothetical protein